MPLQCTEGVFSLCERPKCTVKVYKAPTYTVKVYESPCNTWHIKLVPRNGKPLLIHHAYRSKACAKFVADKLIGGIFK